ncbi:MAG TPA: DoxX family protein [Bryobacteraceae bacterium]|jgi:uncharacterized membrane protein YphA (DoxX/SURF4 family)|nr:DoxX family protein [Bryobacteraceae bacterium]
MKTLFLAGRVILGGFFVYSGINHFKSKQALAGYAAAKGLPSPELGVLGSGALMIAGGASLILGYKPKMGAAALISFLAAASPLFHDFWNDQEPQAKQNNLIHFSKNLAILGAALALAGVKEPWPLSVE